MWSNDGSYIFVISGEYRWVGYKLTHEHIYARRRLASLAPIEGLFGSIQPEPPISANQAYEYTESDIFVWMRVSQNVEPHTNGNGAPEIIYSQEEAVFLRGGYETADPRSDEIFAVLEEKTGRVFTWRDISSGILNRVLAAGNSHTVGLNADGTVVAVGNNRDGQLNVSDWTDIVAVAAGSSHTVGLRADGTVVAVGDNERGQLNVSDWEDIIAVAAGSRHTAGLRVDGTIVVAGDDGAILATGHGGTIAVGGHGGTVVVLERGDARRFDISSWNIDWRKIAIDQANRASTHKVLETLYTRASIGAYGAALDGFRRLGNYNNARARLLEISENIYAQAETAFLEGDYEAALGLFGILREYKETRSRIYEVWEAIIQEQTGRKLVWRDISSGILSRSLAAGHNHTVGLRADGTVIAVGLNRFGQNNVSDWIDIIAVTAGGGHTVGLRADGSVIAVGHNFHGQCNVSDWEDIIAVTAGSNHTVGLLAGGTVVAVGSNRFGQGNVSGWNNIAAVAAGLYHTGRSYWT